MPPLKVNRASPDMRQSFTNLDANDGDAASVPDVAVIQLPNAATQDPLIASQTTVGSNSDEFNPISMPALSTCKRVLYGVASPPSPMCFNILAFLMTVYLLETAKLPPKHVLVISFAGRFWDALSDPLVGYLVSRTNTRFGQCRVWIAASTPLCAVSFYLFFNTPSWDSLTARYMYYFVIYMAFCTLMTAYQIPYTAMTMLISNRPVDRDAATTFRMLFEMVGTLFGVMVFTFITQQGGSSCDSLKNSTNTLNTTEVDAPVGLGEVNRYRLGAGIISCLVLLCGFIGFCFTREVVQQTPSGEQQQVEGLDQQQDSASMLIAFKRCMRHKPYIILMTAFMLSSLSVQTVQSTLALYTIYSLDMRYHLKFAIAIVMSVAICATPAIFFLIKKFGKKRVYYLGMVLIIPVCITATVTPGGYKFVPAYYVTVTFAGLFVSINMLLPWIMLPDVIDDYTVNTNGRRDQATFYSLYVFFNKFAVGVSAAMLQMGLHFAGYRQDSVCAQPALVGTVLRFIIGPVPIVIVLLAMLVLHWYPITPKYRRRIDDKLKLQDDCSPSGIALETAAVQLAVSNSCSQLKEDTPESRQHSPQFFDSSDKILNVAV